VETGVLLRVPLKYGDPAVLHSGMTEAELRDLLSVGREQRNVEFKTAGARNDKLFLIIVARAAMALSNTKDGGWIILGIDDKTLEAVGLSDAQLATWTHDALADSLKEYAAPYVDFDIEMVKSGPKTCVAIRIREFARVPLLCIKEYQDKLRRGGCYVRSRHKPESREVSTETDMRELIALAAAKELRAFLRTTAEAGLQIAELPNDDKKFEQQLFDMIKEPSTLLEKTLSRGYWKFTFRPVDFNPQRLELDKLRSLVEELIVTFRGWNFPHDNPNKKLAIGADWIEYSNQFAYHLDTWRFYQSGYFIYFRSIWEDWEDQAEPPLFTGETVPGWKPGQEIFLENAVYTYSEATEFAARFASSPAGGDRVVVGIDLYKLKGRALKTSQQMGWPLTGKIADIQNWEAPHPELTKAELLANSKSIARRLLRDLCIRFHWNVKDDILQNWQASLIK